MVLLPPGYRHALEGLDLGPWPLPPLFLEGGPTRRATVIEALDALAALDERVQWVGIHDGARPLVGARLVSDVFAQAKRTGCAAPALPIHDSVRRLSQTGWENVSRTNLVRIQTPQIFSYEILSQVLSRLDASDPRDEATTLQAEGIAVTLVPGERENIKVTRKEDLEQAERWLLSEREQQTGPGLAWRSGLGFDAHRLVPGRRLMLGTLAIEHPFGLKGHSDGDVLCHAVADALLSAAGLGDLGRHFPSSDPGCKDLSGRDLLRRTAGLLASGGWRPMSVDALVICEQPALSPYRSAMESAMAEALSMGAQTVTVKATSTDGLGFPGRGEGIAAQAVVVVSKRDDLAQANTQGPSDNDEDAP